MDDARPISSRDRILAAAEALFLTRGVEAVSVAEICRGAGVSNGSFFHHFPNKDALAVEIVMALRRDYWSALLAAMEPCEDAREGVAGVIRAAFAYHRQFPERYLLSRSNEAPWLRGMKPRLRDDNAPYRGRAARWIAAHAAAGRLPYLQPGIYGALLFGAAHWILQNAHSGAEPTAFDRAADQLVKAAQQALTP